MAAKGTWTMVKGKMTFVPAKKTVSEVKKTEETTPTESAPTRTRQTGADSKALLAQMNKDYTAKQRLNPVTHKDVVTEKPKPVRTVAQASTPSKPKPSSYIPDGGGMGGALSTLAKNAAEARKKNKARKEAEKN